MPFVSIVVPIHRTPPEYLRDCLDSVADQTRVADCELILVDDASGRDYRPELDAAAKAADQRVDVIRTTRARRGGPGAARATGAEAARGDYVLFLDSDDALDPRAVEAVAPALAGGCALAFTDEARVTADGARTIVVRDKRAYADLHRRHAGTVLDPLIHATWVCHGQFVRRADLEAIGGPRTDVELGDEMDLPIRLAEHAPPERIVHVPEVLYRYRRHDRSLVHDAAARARLVTCLERIVAEGARRRGVDVARATRIGRVRRPADVAHYALADAAGRRLDADWFDYDALSLRPTASS